MTPNTTVRAAERALQVADPYWTDQITYDGTSAEALQTIIESIENTPTIITVSSAAISLNSELTISAGQVIKLLGASSCVLSCINDNRAIRIAAPNNILFLENIIISGGKAENGGGVLNSGTLVLLAGSSVKLCYASNDGGGVYNSSAVTVLELRGGTIDQCTAVRNGGGAYIPNNSHFNGTEGSIVSCTAGGDGGAVYTPDYNLSKITANAGFIFNGNSARHGSRIIKKQDAAVYAANIKATAFTDPFTNAYNNYDIAYPLIVEAVVSLRARKRGVNKPLTDGQFEFGVYEVAEEREIVNGQ